MPETPARPGEAIVAPDESLVGTTHAIYALHSLSVLIGLTSAATVIGAFVFGVPSIVAVLLNYARRGAVRGTMLDSHFRWQIRTFWFALLWIVVGVLLFVTLLGIPFALLIWGIATAWVVYRVARGWIRLSRGEPMPV